ncbi:MAG: S1/P1 nuclease [Pseudomonadota bacterium]
MFLRRNPLFATLLLVIIGLFNPAYAWTGSGHRWVAGLAWDHMTPEAQELTYQLLISGQDVSKCEQGILSNIGRKKDAFIGASSWSDCVRDQPGFGMYHADRYPLCPGLGRSACHSGHCATDSLMQAIHDLNDLTAPLQTRRRAVKTIIHLVGDLHQPLHVVATGPIDMVIKTNENDKPRRMHEYWDYDVMVGVKENKQLLLKLIQEKGHVMTAGTWDDWMAETAAQGKKIAYGELLGGEAKMCTAIASIGNTPVLITKDYAEKASQLGVQKIAQAAVRLAHIFNQVAHNHKNGSSSPSRRNSVLKDNQHDQEQREEAAQEKALKESNKGISKIGNHLNCSVEGTPKDSFCYTCKNIEDYELIESGLKTAEASCKTIAGNFAQKNSVVCRKNQRISNDNGILTCH